MPEITQGIMKKKISKPLIRLQIDLDLVGGGKLGVFTILSDIALGISPELVRRTVDDCVRSMLNRLLVEGANAIAKRNESKP